MGECESLENRILQSLSSYSFDFVFILLSLLQSIVKKGRPYTKPRFNDHQHPPRSRLLGHPARDAAGGGLVKSLNVNQPEHFNMFHSC